MNRYSLSFRLTLIATAIYFFICTICIALLIAVLSIDLEENLEAELEHHAHTIEALLPPLLTLIDDRHDKSIMDAERITMPRLAQELDPITTATNELLDKITELLNEQQAMLAREKRFTLNAAHELLTPLAALKTEMQLYQKEFIESDNAQADALKELDRRVDRAVHTVEQLVTLARTETDIHQQTAFKALNLSDIFQDITADLGNLIDEKNLALNYDVSDALMIQGEETQIHLLLKNILGNAIKYFPENSKLSCCAAQQGNHITITIRNNGRTIPDYLKEALFEPFVRGPGERESGSGLGLAIAKQICLLHNADLTLTNDTQ